MIRDGRSTVHSIISRKVTITGFNLDSFKDCMIRWNNIIEHMYAQCIDVGPETCMPVYYEQLVLHPEENMRSILKFLNIPFDDAVLHHEQYIGNLMFTMYNKSWLYYGNGCSIKNENCFEYIA